MWYLFYTFIVYTITVKASGATCGQMEMKWNESGFRPPVCTYRLNWAMRTSWGWWNDWDDTVFQTQDAKFEPWRFEGEHVDGEETFFVSFKPPRPGAETQTLAWKVGVLTTALGPPLWPDGDSQEMES